MTRILVSMETFFSDRPIPVYGAWVSYIQKLTSHNLLPLFINPLMNQVAIDELYQLSDGVYFMGGSDFDPIHYNHKKHPNTTITEPKRDNLELNLLRRTLADKKPFLGICRGCQALAIASGGTLVQHVPDVVHHENHSIGDQPYEKLKTDNKHPIIIEKTSRVYKLLKKERIMANSGHHQAAATVGLGFRITGKSEDGIAEIIENTHPDYFCFAVQSHPEAEINGDLEPLFTAFAKATQTYNTSRKK